ncbi:MAG: Spy/CpxP family protein refolding chaperone [Rhodocyclaceae bacterium]|nr:Spy/CpxP family protein refolding chaperone [Rhodocyclaceae bacterium]
MMSKKITVGVVCLMLAATSWAGPGRGCQGPFAWEDMPMGRAVARPGDPVQRIDRHLAYLKDQLGITAEQEPLWQAYVEKARAELGKGRALQWDAAAESLPLPERFARMEKAMEDRLTAIKEVHAAFLRLYETLSSEQKARADRLLGQRMRRAPAPLPKG